MKIYTLNSTTEHVQEWCSSAMGESGRTNFTTYSGLTQLCATDESYMLKETTNSSGVNVDGNSNVSMTVYGTMPETASSGDYYSIYFGTGKTNDSDTSKYLSYEWKYKYTTTTALKSVKVKSSSVAYTGKSITQTLTVKDTDGNKVSSSNYTVTYSNNKKVGKATVKVTGKGSYSGTVKTTFKIVPKKTTISSVKSSKSKRMVVKWKKNTTGKGYQIAYSTNKKFTSKTTKKITISKNTTKSKTIKSLKAGKKYYVRIRAYKKVSGITYYGAWSNVKSVKVKK